MSSGVKFFQCHGNGKYYGIYLEMITLEPEDGAVSIPDHKIKQGTMILHVLNYDIESVVLSNLKRLGFVEIDLEDMKLATEEQKFDCPVCGEDQMLSVSEIARVGDTVRHTCSECQSKYKIILGEDEPSFDDVPLEG